MKITALGVNSAFATGTYEEVISVKDAFDIASKAATSRGLATRLPNGVCNPVRNIYCQGSENIPAKIAGYSENMIAGRGLQPRPKHLLPRIGEHSGQDCRIF